MNTLWLFSYFFCLNLCSSFAWPNYLKLIHCGIHKHKAQPQNAVVTFIILISVLDDTRCCFTCAYKFCNGETYHSSDHSLTQIHTSFTHERTISKDLHSLCPPDSLWIFNLCGSLKESLLEQFLNTGRSWRPINGQRLSLLLLRNWREFSWTCFTKQKKKMYRGWWCPFPTYTVKRLKKNAHKYVNC